ncbi:SDR family oxidoreductase [Streptomyces sp. S465]|nr:SDR family oxidoreductase [Streptomyces sp. S465]
MRWLVTGAGGMLGRDTVGELRRRGEDVTPMHRVALDITSPGAMSSYPARRPGTAAEAADAVVFLAGDEASYIHGVLLPVDGRALTREPPAPRARQRHAGCLTRGASRCLFSRWAPLPAGKCAAIRCKRRPRWRTVDAQCPRGSRHTRPSRRRGSQP